MKTCMIATNHQLKDDRIYWKEAISLKKNGYEVFCVILGDKNEKGETCEGIKYEIIKREVSKCKIGIFRRMNNLLVKNKLNYKRILNCCKKINADIYHFHDLDLNYVGIRLKKYNNKNKVIYDVHEYFPDMIRDYGKNDGLIKIVKKIYAFYKDIWELSCSKKYDYIITADDATKNRFMKVNSNVQVVHNFSEFEVLDEKIKESYDKKEFDGIYCGGITKVRGAVKILEMIKLAKKEKENIKFLFLGPICEPMLNEYINEFILENNLKNNIVLKGIVPHSEVSKYLLKSKIGFVTLLPIPKYYKNIPIKQFEYMSYGLPVVGSNLPPICSFVKEAKSGIIVNPNDPVEMWNAMKKILSDKELYYKYSSNGIKAVREKYNWKNAENVLLKVYKNIY